MSTVSEQEVGAAAKYRGTVGRRPSCTGTRALRAGGLISAPLLWLGLIYLVALVALFITAFWTVDFGTAVTREWNLDNFKKLYEQEVYRTVILRTHLGGHRGDASSMPFSRCLSRSIWRSWLEPARRHSWWSPC